MNEKIKCPWCSTLFEIDKTEEEYKQQVKDDIKKLIELGYEPIENSIITVCDDCYKNRYTEKNIEKRYEDN